MQMRNICRLILFLILILSLANFAFARSGKKVVYGVFLDNSISLSLRFDQVQTLSKGLAQYIIQSNAVDSMSLFSFKTQAKNKTRLAIVNLGVDWSRDENLLNSYIDNLTIEDGDTALLDAIYFIAEKINAKAALDKTISRKVIVLLTDGEEVKSRIKERQLIKELKDNNIQVYAIGLDNGFVEQRDESLVSPKEKSENRLKKITKETGGRVVFLKSATINSGEVIKSLLEDANR